MQNPQGTDPESKSIASTSLSAKPDPRLSAPWRRHECLVSSVPLIVREHAIISVKTPADLAPVVSKGRSVLDFQPQGLFEVWDGVDFTPVVELADKLHLAHLYAQHDWGYAKTIRRIT
jgi:hypothetical protein